MTDEITSQWVVVLDLVDSEETFVYGPVSKDRADRLAVTFVGWAHTQAVSVNVLLDPEEVEG